MRMRYSLDFNSLRCPMKTDKLVRLAHATADKPVALPCRNPGGALGKTVVRELLLRQHNGDYVAAFQRPRATVADVSAQEEDQDAFSDTSGEGEFCMPAEIIVDNNTSKEFTVLTVEVQDYPGLVSHKASSCVICLSKSQPTIQLHSWCGC
jgi:hypothetical protein